MKNIQMYERESSTWTSFSSLNPVTNQGRVFTSLSKVSKVARKGRLRAPGSQQVIQCIQHFVTVKIRERRWKNFFSSCSSVGNLLGLVHFHSVFDTLDPTLRRMFGSWKTFSFLISLLTILGQEGKRRSTFDVMITLID